MARAKKKTRAAPKRAAPRAAPKRAAPKRAAPRAAPKRAAPGAAKKEAKKMAKSKPAAPAVNPVVAAAAKSAEKVRAAKATRATGLTGWKDNKYGYSAAAICCYNCAWFEPHGILEPREPQPGQKKQASQFGWCRGDSVEQQNLNAAWGATGQILTTDYNVPPSLIQNEPIIRDATEFWCGQWTRARNQFLWPPAEALLPPPWQPGGGPSAPVEEPE